MKNDTLKEYYVKLESLWNNVTNILLAINQSLHTNASEVTVQISDTDDATTTVRIPSFLYLENKLESLSNNFSNLFNMPNSGEAWFSSNENNNMYKLEMVRANTSPLSPIFDTNNLYASLTDNNFLKDLVSPKTFLKVNISNLPDNINKLYMKKYIIYDYSIFSMLSGANPKTYEDFISNIYNLKKGIDYDEYDSILDTPIKNDQYKSNFKIVNIPDENNNPWIDSTNQNNSKYSYKLELDTLKYTHIEDTSIEFTLKPGDKLCLGNEMAIYKIKNVNISTNTIIIEEEVGHILLQRFDFNSNMCFKLYNTDYSKYHYINVPLEENPYICVFLGTIYNNVRSLFSSPLLINLNEIYMTDQNGQFIYDSNGNKLTYIQYYTKECTNIGDLILGLTQSAYPQLTLLDVNKLQRLQNDGELGKLIDQSINNTSILNVVPINKHTQDNTKTEEVISLHAQRNELTSQLVAINNSISTTNNKLLSTDFNQDIAITYKSLQTQLSEYYSERLLLQKQLISVVENINSNISFVVGKDLKYRIRGICNTEAIEEYLKTSIDPKLDIIGMDVEYKYKSLNKPQSSLTLINSNIFTDWNKFETIDKQRKIKFDNILNTYVLEFENYDSTRNIIRWNQIDIPIVSDEDVIIRVRYKYNIGQPFVNIYSAWSEEITIVFPTELKENVEISSILSENNNDIISAKFNNTLINDGYQEHINNSLIVSDGTFYHMPENIYSGFNTNENKLISLKDKLQLLSNDIDKYNRLVNNLINQKYKVYLVNGERSYEIRPNMTNTINIFNDSHISSTFVKNKMSLVIRNEGDVIINLYSIFPGNVNIPLLLCSYEYYEKLIINYERVPIFINNELSYQRLGQWIYFRQNDFWTSRKIYEDINNDEDYNTAMRCYGDSNINNTNKVAYPSLNNNPISIYNNQKLLGFRKRKTTSIVEYKNSIQGWTYDNNTDVLQELPNNIDAISDQFTLDQLYANFTIDFFMYENVNNNYILRYEDIFFNLTSGNKVYLDENTSITEFVENYNNNNNASGVFNNENAFIGGFLYPDIDVENNILTNGGVNDYIEIPVGKQVSIPITLEYFINNEIFNKFNTTKITKSLCFDIKTSLYNDIEHYNLEVVINNDNTASGNMINSVSLIDETINM